MRLHRRLIALVGTALSIATAPLAVAQPAGASGMDCKMLARMPNAPMTVEQCERQMAIQAEMTGAMNAPGGERPGDDKLTCAQIVEELKTMRVGGVSPANAVESKSAGEDLKASVERAQAEAAALSATQTARNAGAAAASAAGVPGVSAAANAANMAEQKALQDRVAAQVNPARQRAMQANANSMADLAKSMRENPRFARLIRLAGERNCQG